MVFERRKKIKEFCTEILRRVVLFCSLRTENCCKKQLNYFLSDLIQTVKHPGSGEPFFFESMLLTSGQKVFVSFCEFLVDF